MIGGTTGSASDQQSTNDRKIAGSRPTKVVCITVLTGNRLGWTVRCGRPPLLLPSCKKLEFRLSALMDSDLAWVNRKSGRQSWCYADAFQRSIISEAIYHFTILFIQFTILFHFVTEHNSQQPLQHVCDNSIRWPQPMMSPEVVIIGCDV